MDLPPASSPEKAVILLLTVYFILNLFPLAFRQCLGLVQTFIVKSRPFDSGLMSFKLVAVERLEVVRFNIDVLNFW